MSNKKCDNCYFGDLCRSAEICDHYAPITEQAEDEYLAELAQEDKIEYRRAWNAYMMEHQG